MGERHCLETTSEQTRDDGVIISSTDLKIWFDFVWGHDGYFDPVEGIDFFPTPDEITLLSVEERTPEGWEQARDTFQALAECLIDVRPELFSECARNAKCQVKLQTATI